MNEIKEKYLEYLNLNYVKSRQDSDEEPYKTKYEARKLIQSLLKQIESVAATSSEPNNSEFLDSTENADLKNAYRTCLAKLTTKTTTSPPRLFVVNKLFEYFLSRNFIETDEVDSGEKILSTITRELDRFDFTTSGFEYNALTISLKLSCLNELIYVWSTRGDYNRCSTLIEAIDEIYRAFQTEMSKQSPLAPFDLIELIELDPKLTHEKRCSTFEALYTHSLFYFAQVYGKLEEREKAANYCRLTLQRQMDEHLKQQQQKQTNCTNNDDESTTSGALSSVHERILFNALDWATHAAALSQYYQCTGDFATARHCLCCAEAILDKLNNRAEDKKPENLNEQTASIKRCWGKYAIELLKTSKQKLIDDSVNSTTLATEIDKVSKFRFRLPEAEYHLTNVEKAALTSNLALDYDQARAIFLKAQSILNETKEYFKFDGFVTDHCEILRDLSDLYAALAFFDADATRKCKMHKRRLDLLEPACAEISEQFYLTLKRQLLFDCGSILSEMIDLKIDIFKSEMENKKVVVVREKAEAMKSKINQMIEKSLKYFEHFLDTMKVQPTRDRLPDKFDEHNIRPALLAKFYIGRLYSKFIMLDPAKKLANMKNTLENYSYLVDYCDRFKEETSHMVNEYNVCKEMVFLLPKEMEKVRMTIV